MKTQRSLAESKKHRYSSVKVFFGAVNGSAFPLMIEYCCWRNGRRRVSKNMEECIMRGTYEAYILVKVKDGRKYVCALNRKLPQKDGMANASFRQQQDYLESMVIWN